MLRIVITAATFVAMCAVTFATVSAAEPQRSIASATATAIAPTIQVYSNPS
jgi:hypothetical protein